MKISALWITKNEEENIERSIKSVAAAVDELIVVDTGSTDNTAGAARGLGAKVVDFAWINDFSAAKNFALDQAEGEIIIFLDADEWFEPALSPLDRDEIIRRFSTQDIDTITCPMENLDQFGKVKTTLPQMRIFHIRDQLRYENKIHEKLAKPDGSVLKKFAAQDWIIKHSGYAENKLDEKAKRNLALLESIKDDPKLSTLNKFYLMRENYYSGKTEESYEYFDELLHSKKRIAEFTAEYADIAPQYFYMTLNMAQTFRHKVSRKEVYANVVNHMKKLLPRYPGTANIDLYYGLLFARDEKKFLDGLAAYEKAKKRPDSEFTGDDFYKPALVRLYGTAAETRLARGEKEAAMEYALKTMTSHSGKSREEYIKIFIQAAKGAEETAVVLLLSKLVDLMDGEISESFLENLMYENLKNAYLYFFKKQYEAGMATKARFLYLKILNGNPREAVGTALANHTEMTEENLSELIFCAVICEGDDEFYAENKERLGKYGDVAAAYFENRVLESAKFEDVMIYIHEYRSIVFAAGRETGDRFLAVFANNPSLRFMIKCEYYMEGGLYEAFLAEEEDVDPATLHPTARMKLAKCRVLAGHYEQAFSLLQKMFERNQLNYDILNSIWIISEKATGSVREEAGLLREEYAAILEEITDLSDIVNTGVVFDEITKKEKRALAALAPRDFKKEMFNTSVIPSERLRDVYMAAADAYMEKGLHGMAERYLRRLLVSGHKTAEVYGKLAETYGKLGNAVLAAELETLSAKPNA